MNYVKVWAHVAGQSGEWRSRKAATVAGTPGLQRADAVPEMVARTLGLRWCSTERSLLSDERMEEIGRGRDESRRRAAGGSGRRGRPGARGAARRRGVAGGVACGAVTGAAGGPNFAGGGGFGAAAGGRARRARARQAGTSGAAREKARRCEDDGQGGGRRWQGR